MTRPVVGLTLGAEGTEGVYPLRPDYVRAVERAGAVPVLLPPFAADQASSLLDRLDGLLLTGGADVDPELYGRAPHPRLGRVERRRDECELALTREALRRDLPILAICRGQQVLNVATGGTLVQDIPSELEGASEHDGPGPRTRVSHEAAVLPGTRLFAILGRDAVSVNSFHHQAVDALGEGVVASARCPADGVIEAIEMPSRRFVVAVQWHPESFWEQASPFQALFQAHVGACR